jgi:hypothetical protein
MIRRIHDDGYIINSDFLNDLSVEDAKKIVIEKIEEQRNRKF